jgi:hypothetical protein
VGGSNLTALSIASVATWDNSSNVNNGGSVTSSHIVQGSSSTCSPTMPTAPTFSTSSCVSNPGGAWGTFVWGPASANGVICYEGLTVGANGSTCTLNPGIYVIYGGTLHFESGSGGYSNYGGDGVFFYLTNGANLVIDNGANVNLVSGGSTQSGGGTAPTVGAYNGILFFEDPSDTQAISIQGGSNSYFAGSIYAPAAAITMGNGSTLDLNGGIVASSLTLSGGGTIEAIATTNEGSTSLGGYPKLVQ